MKALFFTLIVIAFAASCDTPEPITARPDPNAAGSGTLGSVKATDGSVLQQSGKDTAILREEDIKK